jgi:hypothetical protein
MGWILAYATAIGISFAEPALLLSMASILHNFTIAPESSETVVVEFTTGITRCAFIYLN